MVDLYGRNPALRIDGSDPQLAGVRPAITVHEPQLVGSWQHLGKSQARRVCEIAHEDVDIDGTTKVDVERLRLVRDGAKHVTRETEPSGPPPPSPGARGPRPRPR